MTIMIIVIIMTSRPIMIIMTSCIFLHRSVGGEGIDENDLRRDQPGHTCRRALAASSRMHSDDAACRFLRLLLPEYR